MELSFLSGGILGLFILITTPWVILSLVSTGADVGVGFVDEWLLKKLNKKTKGQNNVDAPGRLILISGFFGLVISITTVIFLLGINQISLLNIPKIAALNAFGAGMLEVLWLIPYFYSLQRGGAVNVTPLFQTIPIFSLIFGLLLFAEIPSLIHIFGTVIIILGAGFLNFVPENKKLDTHTLLLMFCASAVISLGYFLFKDSTISGNFLASLFWNGLGMTFLSSVIWTTWPPYRKQFQDFVSQLDFKVLGIQFLNESLYALSAITNQLAIVIGPSIMAVSSFNAFHPIFTLMFGFFLARLSSSSQRRQLSGLPLSLKIIGVLLISSGALLIVTQGN